MKRYLKLNIFLQAGLLVLLLGVECPQMQAQPNVKVLTDAIGRLDADAAMQSANWSICVRDVQSGRVLAGHNEHRSLPTASTLKALTSATALGILGPDFRFATYLEYSGRIEQGVLEGNLYIRGTGDPSLGSDRFEGYAALPKLMLDWVEVLRQKGIKRIAGKVIADASAFDTQLTPGKWSWEDMGNYYGAGVSGLNINENLYRLDFVPGAKAGDDTRILRSEPYIPGLRFINEVTTGTPRSGDNAYIFGAPYTFERYVRGTIPAGRPVFSIKGSMPDPALFCAQYLSELLDSCGIPAAGATSLRLEQLAGRQHTGRRSQLHRHLSPPLKELIVPLNMESINLYAEALCKQIAVASGKPGSTAQGVEVMQDFWKERGVNTRGMMLRDGSGLSANNALSTAQLTFILSKAHRASWGQAFYQSLPLAGRSGSLKNMLRGSRAENNLRAKSGYIAGVRSYAGFVDTRSGKRLAFAVIAHNYSGSPGAMRRKLEQLMAALAEIP